MHELNLPPVSLEIKNIDGKYQIFDVIRKKYVALTPEEWVRQNFIHYLIKYHNYPKGLIKIEGGLRYNKLLKRSDLLVHDHSGSSYLLVECKSYDVSLDQKTIDQAAIYNKKLQAQFMMITNGLSHYCFTYDREQQQFILLDEVPPAPGK